MTQAEQLADFIVTASFDDMSTLAVRELKTRVLDALGCALGALDNELIRLLYDQFLNSPLPWDAVEEKFNRLADPCADRVLRKGIVDAIANIDQIRLSELTELLGRVQRPGRQRTPPGEVS